MIAMTTILVCGASDWSDRATMTKYLVRLPRETTRLRLCGSGPVNEMAQAVAAELGLEVLVHEGWDAKRPPALRASVLLSEVRPAAVIAFTNALVDARGSSRGPVT